MDSEIQLISDGDGLLVIGERTAVKEFLVSEGLWPSSKEIGRRFKSILSTSAAVAQAGSEIAANSRYWLKMTRESARLADKYGLRKAAESGRPTGVVLGKKGGQIGKILEFEKGARSVLNPAMLSGIAGIMAQAAMQQSMAEITAYLARVDEKLDDVRRDQRAQVLARMDGADLVISRAMTVRDQAGRTNKVTWSTVADAAGKIGDTQSYALGQLAGLAEKMERKSKVGDLAKTAKKSESEIRMWLYVLGHCLSLQDAFDVLELDRVSEVSPNDLDGHGRGLKADRQKRLDAISQATERLMARMDAAAHRANTKLLWHPTTSPAVVHSSNHVATDVRDFHGLLGIESGRQPCEARRWMDAVAEARDKALENAGPTAASITGGGVVGVVLALKVLQDRGRKAE